MSVRLIATLLFTTAIAVSVPAAAQTPPVAAYGLNETSGTLASDASGNGHTGTLTGATWTAAGKFGGAATFNGTTDWLTVNHSSLLSLTSAMTLEAWVKTGSATGWRTVMLKETSNGLSYGLYAGDLGGRPAGYIRRTADIDATSSSLLPLDQWVHLATTYDGATLRVFVNGVEAAATAITGSIVTSTLPLRIGGNSAWGEYFSGQIDEVRVYNRALSAGEIQTDMNTPVSGVAADTYSISGSIAPASSGSGATVALTGLGSMSTTADANGNYSFVGLRPFLYQITPAKSGFTFSPASREVRIGEGGNITGIDFTAIAVTVSTPSVSLTAPAAGATVGGTVQLSATASDDVGVAGVQFQIDGVNVGPEIIAPPYSTTWDTTTTPGGPHTVRAIARDAAGNVAISSATVSVDNTANPAVAGQWGSSFDLGTVAVNMAMLRTGKVLMFSGQFAFSSPERIWDPVTGAITLVPNPFYNLFCSGLSQLPDGRILVAGGYDSASLGARNANIFDPVTLAWTAVPNMTYRRWYPAVTTLPDGRALVSSGAQSCLTCLADVPEIFDPATNRFTTMPSSRMAIDYYPFMFVLPDGQVLSAGSTEEPYETRTLNVTTGAWTMIDPVVKDGHSAVMYRPGKVLKTGTAADSGTPGISAPTAYVIDMTQPSPVWRQVASMRYPRAFQNSTILPDGNVLITGGGTSLEGYDVTKGVLVPELWSPATETFTTLSSAAYARLYHATALLLPDARVLMAGSGNDGPAVNNTRGEIYSPPYLFKGPRPTIAAAPALIQYGGAFTVQTPDASSIASVALIRPGSVTHSFDNDQRYVPLSFTANAGSLTVQAPANANLAPPGYYMLFLVNASGVPSVASFVRFPAPASDTTAPSVPANLTGTGGLGTVSLTWSAATDNQGVVLYNVHRGTVSGLTATLANRVAQTAQTAFSASLAPGTYFFAVTAQDAVGNISGQSSEFAVTVFADATPPTVALTSPADQGTVSGSVSLVATASDTVGVVGVQFLLDGAPLGAERTTAPYAMTWDSTSVPDGPHTIAASARDAAGNRSEAVVAVNVSNVAPPPVDATPPDVALTSPADQGTVSGSVSLVATASDDVGVVGVQFLLDGAPLGAERTTAPYAMTWNSTSVPNGPHTIAASARDAAGNRSETAVAVTVSNLAPPPPPPAPTGLVAAYNFDEGTGTQVLDLSGRGHHGSASNTTWSTAGRTGAALSFNGTSSWVTIADTPALRLTTGMTIEAWVRPTSRNGWRTVILKERSGNLAYSLYASTDNSSRPHAWIETAEDDYSVNGPDAISINTWTHLAATYDGTALRLYINGVLVRTRTGDSNIRSGAGALRIGGNAVWGEYFRGLIDDVRIYNRALTQAQIQSDMNTPVR